eukprot:GHVU01030192.1.p1 GENE.GHVU01030192.1~~GHVU01030192.1.p1  ORF type:complete len:117 (-),score=1.47 GHVU01030192.1:115-465(-)
MKCRTRSPSSPPIKQQTSVHPLIRSRDHSLAHYFSIHSSICSFVHSFIHDSSVVIRPFASIVSLLRPFVHSFVLFLLFLPNGGRFQLQVVASMPCFPRASSSYALPSNCTGTMTAA